jgi:hypothetical protein
MIAIPFAFLNFLSWASIAAALALQFFYYQYRYARILIWIGTIASLIGYLQPYFPHA